VGVLADLTGRSHAEIKLALGAALTAGGVALAFRTVKVLIDIGPRPQSTRTAARGAH